MFSWLTAVVLFSYLHLILPKIASSSSTNIVLCWSPYFFPLAWLVIQTLGVSCMPGTVKILLKSRRWVQMLGYKWHFSWHFTGDITSVTVTSRQFEHCIEHVKELTGEALIYSPIHVLLLLLLLFAIICCLISLCRLHNHNPPTYETGSTRKFLLGRTDTIRSASIASDEFVKAMVSPNKTVSFYLQHAMVKTGLPTLPSSPTYSNWFNPK